MECYLYKLVFLTFGRQVIFLIFKELVLLEKRFSKTFDQLFFSSFASVTCIALNLLKKVGEWSFMCDSRKFHNLIGNLG